jgi:UDP-N-acetylmuramoyl-tripeptide--D-alanyl-D-alanine ligase
MFELGPDSTEEHQKLGNILAGLGFDEVLLCGKEMQVAAQDHPQFKYFKTKAALNTWLQQHTLQDTNLLIKGSRGMGLESLLEVL